jgi:NAD(P)-dependent dehydrogenase (short-subunit alcohol dehydrogenase family)
VVVTGAGRGLGLAMARRIGADGATVHIAELHADRGERAAAELAADGMDARFVQVDVADPGSVERMAEVVTADGPVYGLVNNAGLADAVGGKLFHEIEVADWDQIMAVNARGPWLVSRALVPGMIAAGVGRVVNISSDSVLYGSPRLAHYISSKGAVMALTRAMAREVGEHGITVNTVAPGLTESESSARIPAERHELYRRNRAISRPQVPGDMAGLVAFVLGPEAEYLTGQLMVVDGGWMLH